MSRRAFFSKVSYADAINKAKQAGCGIIKGQLFNQKKQFVVFAEPSQSIWYGKI